MTYENNVSDKLIRDLLGKNLKRLRIKAGLSLFALAAESGFTLTFLNDIENGKKWVSCKTMVQLCNVLQAEPNQFFFPASTPEQEHSDILSGYIDDFSDSVLKSVADFKNRYL
jgi:transcriptional regulator with XRE-family HTH domain